MDDTNPTPEKKTVDERLEEIATVLHRMDARDHRRMVGSTIRAIISLIPLILLVWSTWYFIAHGTELIQMITKQTVQQMTGFGGSNSSVSDDGMIQELLKQLQGVKTK